MSTIIQFPGRPDAVQAIEVETEQAVIGVMLRHSDALPKMLEICSPSDFAHAPHGAIVSAIIDAQNASQPITCLFLGQRLCADPALNALGGTSYLEAMRDRAPAGGFIPLARSLVDMQLRREIVDSATLALDAAQQSSVTPVQALQPILETADRVSAAIAQHGRKSIREAADALIQEAYDRAAGRVEPAATTGLNLLDETIGGLQGGNLVVYAGRPGMGKTCQLMNTALRSAMEGRPVIFFSLEMTLKELLERVGCDLDYDENAASPLSYSWFRNGSAKPDQIVRLGEALRRLPDNLKVVDDGSLTIHEIAAQARAFAAQQSRMGVVVIDYLQKVAATDRYRGNRVQEVTEISGAAKVLAKSINWPVVVGAQLNRGVESREEKRPNLSDLRESGSIEQDADAVIGLYRPAYYIEKRKPAQGRADPGWTAWEMEFEAEKNRLDFFVLKNRHGSEDSIAVFCDMRASAIRDDAPRGAR